MNKTTQDKLAKIQDLLNRKAEIERELETLLNPVPEKVLPADFSMNQAVFDVVAAKDGLKPNQVLAELNRKFPNHGINRRQVASALAYLKNTKETVVRSEETGEYSVSEPGGQASASNDTEAGRVE